MWNVPEVMRKRFVWVVGNFGKFFYIFCYIMIQSQILLCGGVMCHTKGNNSNNEGGSKLMLYHCCFKFVASRYGSN